MRHIETILICCLLVVGFACPSANTAAGKCGQVQLDISDVLHTGVDTVVKLKATGEISHDEAETALHDMNALNDLNGIFGNCVKTAYVSRALTDTYMGCSQSFADGLQKSDLLTTFHLSKPSAEVAIKSTAEAVVTLINTTITTLRSMPSKN